MIVAWAHSMSCLYTRHVRVAGAGTATVRRRHGTGGPADGTAASMRSPLSSGRDADRIVTGSDLVRCIGRRLAGRRADEHPHARHTGPARQPVRNQCVARVLRSRAHRLLPRSLSLLTLTRARRAEHHVSGGHGSRHRRHAARAGRQGGTRPGGATWSTAGGWRYTRAGPRWVRLRAGRPDRSGAHRRRARVYLQGNPRAGRALGIGRIASAGVTRGSSRPRHLKRSWSASTCCRQPNRARTSRSPTGLSR
jgi:hypothetical protein